MTKLLQQAIAQVRELPEEEQDRAAEVLLVLAKSNKRGVYKLSADERAAIKESKAQAARGEFATEEEVDELLNRPWA